MNRKILLAVILFLGTAVSSLVLVGCGKDDAPAGNAPTFTLKGAAT